MNTPLKRVSRVKCLTVRGHKAYVDWRELPAGCFTDDLVRPEIVTKATLAGHERSHRCTKSHGRGSRKIDRDFKKAAFYAD